MKGEIVVLYLHALDSNGNKSGECNFENNSWDRQGHLGRKISASLLRQNLRFGLNNLNTDVFVCVLVFTMGYPSLDFETKHQIFS